MVKYQQRHLSRIYPKGTRIDSSNYDPLPAWCGGSQIVALNYQTGDKAMWFNDALFTDNGGCGYVLKPPALIEEYAPPIAPMKLELIVYSGSQLPSGHIDIADPFVKIELRGVPADYHKSRTKCANDSPYHALFNHKVQFNVKRPDLAMILFHVYDKDLGSKDDFMGQTSARVSLMRPGIHAWPLHDAQGVQLQHA